LFLVIAACTGTTYYSRKGDFIAELKKIFFALEGAWPIFFWDNR